MGVHVERVVELFHIVGGEHGVRIHDAVGSAVLPMLLPDALEEAVERGALARLFGHDKDGEPELFRHLHGGIIRALHDDVDLEVFAVIRLAQDGVEEVADDAALVAGGDEERDAPLFAGKAPFGREKTVQELHELGDIQKRGKERRRAVHDQNDVDWLHEHLHGTGCRSAGAGRVPLFALIIGDFCAIVNE